jgi:hypothetical protein
VTLPVKLAAPLDKASINLRLRGESEQFRVEVQRLPKPSHILELAAIALLLEQGR